MASPRHTDCRSGKEITKKIFDCLLYHEDEQPKYPNRLWVCAAQHLPPELSLPVEHFIHEASTHPPYTSEDLERFEKRYPFYALAVEAWLQCDPNREQLLQSLLDGTLADSL
jgi:hypothetical protein